VVFIGQYIEPYRTVVVIEKDTLDLCFSKNVKVWMLAILQERMKVSVSSILTL
jgi:hypothetical protein